MKRFAVLFAAVLALCVPLRAAEKYNCLAINRVDGKVDCFAVSAKTVVTATSDGGVKLADGDLEVIYPSDEVDSFTFVRYNPAGGYEGDKPNVAALADVASAPLNFSVADAVVTVGGAAPGSELQLADLRGRVVARAEADADGSASMSAVGHGVFLLTVNGVTLKIRL